MNDQEAGAAAAVRAVMERYVEAVFKADVDDACETSSTRRP